MVYTENKMLLSELKEHTFEKEKIGAIEITCKYFEFSDELKCCILLSTNEPLNGKYYFPDTQDIGYYKNGKNHRDDNLPAIIWEDGSIFYFINGKQHRIDGPASIYCHGCYYWWINDYDIENEIMNKWLEENNIPLDWNLWTESDKLLFAMHWSDYNV